MKHYQLHNNSDNKYAITTFGLHKIHEIGPSHIGQVLLANFMHGENDVCSIKEFWNNEFVHNHDTYDDSNDILHIKNNVGLLVQTAVMKGYLKPV